MAFKIDDTNYASDADIASTMKTFISHIVPDIQSKRETQNQKMMEYYNIYRTVFDVRYYNGSIEVYDPQLRKNVEFYVSRLKKALFPTDDNFEIEPVNPDSEEFAAPIKEHMKWQIEKKIKLNTKISRFLRQVVMYGWSPVKCIWDRKTQTAVGLTRIEKIVKRRMLDQVTGRMRLMPTGEVRQELVEEEKVLVTHNEPTFDPVDVFNFYVYPPTANSMDEVFGVFEVFHLPLPEVQAKGREASETGSPLYENIDQVTSDDGNDFWSWTRDARLAVDGHQQPFENKEMEYVTVVEYWGLVNFGTRETPKWEQGVITMTSKGVMLQVRKNPFYDKQIPYFCARMTDLQNEFYSDGLIAPLASMQYYINDTLCQTFDSLSYSLNPIVKYDPGRVVNVNSIAFAPGAMWALTDPAAAVFETPSDLSQSGFNAVDRIKQVIEAYPGVANIPMTGRKAATHITAIQQEYSLPIMDLAESIEATVMSPWLSRVYSRNQQYLEEEEIFLVTGKKGIKYWQKLSPEMLIGDYNFFWRGSNASTNIHVRARQLMEYGNVVLPFIPMLQQQGKNFDAEYFLKRIYTEGLAMDGADKLFPSAENDRSIDPQTENLLLSVGKYIPTAFGDNHEEHLQVHEELAANGDEYSRKATMRHMEEHQLRIDQQKLQAASAQIPEPGGESEEQALEGIQPPGP
jgi:hypothetical protein